MEPAKRKYKKRHIWKEHEETAVVELWKRTIHDLRAPGRNARIYETMANELHNQGINITETEIQRKLNNLTTKYKKEKTAMEATNGKPTTWPLYWTIDGILGETPFIKEEINEENFIDEADASNISIFPSTFVAALKALPDLSTSSQQSSPSATVLPSPAPSEDNLTIDDKIVFKRKILSGLNKSFQAMERHLTHMADVDEELIALKKRKVELLEQRVRDGTELKNSVVNFLNSLGDYLLKNN